MAYFGNYIKSIIEAEIRGGKETTAASMAERMGIKSSMMSRFINATKPIGCNPETLRKMISGIGEDRETKDGLLTAFIKDQLLLAGEEASGLELILRKTTRAREEPGDYSLARTATECALDSRSINAIKTIIRACSKSKRFRRSVLDLCEIAEHDILRS